MAEGRVSVLGRIYLILRWPVVIVLLGAAGVVFLVGLLNSLGYQGTTNLRAVNENDPLWKNFQADFNERAGAPFDFNEGDVVIEDGVVQFDRRLIKVFNYLKNKHSQKCGWGNYHERISIDLKAPKYSDESPAKDRPISLSTVSRGVGARISEVDFIKCTEEPVVIDKCRVKAPVKFQNDADPVGTYPIRLSNHADDELKADDYDNVNCKVTCAFDYFPAGAIDATSVEDKVPPTINETVAKISAYSAVPFPIENITQKAKEGAFYKTVLLTYELLHIDDAGCENSKENFGSNRAIPITIHLPEWAKTKLGKDWDSFIETAKDKIPFSFQERSPLAGLWFDRELNDKGLHINF